MPCLTDRKAGRP